MTASRCFQRDCDLPVSAAVAHAWHARPGAFERLMPPWQRMRLIRRQGGLEPGAELEIELGVGPLTLRWLARHLENEPGRRFVDDQVEGPFASWRHEHLFEDQAGGGCRLSDRIVYRLPAGLLGRLVAGGKVARDLERTFRYRHETTRRDLLRHRRLAGPALRVALVGASGLLGRQVAALLRGGGHEVMEIGRHGPDLVFEIDRGIDRPEALEGFDAVIHLAGENVAGGRWTTARKEAIRRSRVDGTRALVESLRGLARPPRVFICASAVGYYGVGEATRDERAPAGDDFLARTCAAWEEAADRAGALGARVVKLRFGVILSPRGGALAKMLPPFRLGLGGRLGSGTQLMSWVSIDDAAAAVLHALRRDDLDGPVNVVAPEVVSNAAWTRTLGRVLRRPTILPMPALGARLAFGEMADAMLLAGQRALPRRLEETGFEFDDPALEPCLRRLLGRDQPGP